MTYPSTSSGEEIEDSINRVDFLRCKLPEIAEKFIREDFMIDFHPLIRNNVSVGTL